MFLFTFKYYLGSASIHGSVKVKRSSTESHSVELTGKDGIVVEKITNVLVKLSLTWFSTSLVIVYLPSNLI
jgi:hypothetical protein